MRTILAAILIIFLTGTLHAQEVSDDVDRGISSVKQRSLDSNAEVRFFVDDGTPEFKFAHKNISLDWIRRDDTENFFKLKLDREIISLMGSGIDWNVALNGYAWKNHVAFMPSAGLNLYVRVRPRWDVYVQFSGMTLGRQGHFTDFESGVKYFPQKDFSVSAGWRRVSFKLKRGGDSADFVLSGAFVGMRYDW